MCRRTRQIVAFVIGDRSAATCRKLWEQIPNAYKGCQSYSDFWEADRLVFPEQTHQCVGKGSGQTNHMERWYNTFRQSSARFVRKTLSFSKSEDMHEIVTRLFIIRYNLSLVTNHYQTIFSSPKRLPEFPNSAAIGRVVVMNIDLRSRPTNDPGLNTSFRNLEADMLVEWKREVIGNVIGGLSKQRYVQTPQGYNYGSALQPTRNLPNVLLQKFLLVRLVSERK